MRLFPAKLQDTEIGENEIHLYKSENHFRNFVDCILSKKETIAPAEVGHRSVSISHLGNIAMMLGQDLDWDPVNETFINNFAANQLLSRQMREPWGTLYKKYVV